MSSIFFPLEIMPQWLRHIVSIIPLTHFTDLVRQVMIGSIKHHLPPRGIKK